MSLGSTVTRVFFHVVQFSLGLAHNSEEDKSFLEDMKIAAAQVRCSVVYVVICDAVPNSFTWYCE